MCCMTEVGPLPEDWKRILTIAGLKENQYGSWIRELTPRNNLTVRMYTPPLYWEGNLSTLDTWGVDHLSLKLEPSIGDHSIEAHKLNAPLAAIMYKICMTIAEQTNGMIIQSAIMEPCKQELEDRRRSRKILAYYPDNPFRFENLCLGFRTALLSGTPQIDGS